MKFLLDSVLVLRRPLYSALIVCALGTNVVSVARLGRLLLIPMFAAFVVIAVLWFVILHLLDFTCAFQNMFVY